MRRPTAAPLALLGLLAVTAPAARAQEAAAGQRVFNTQCRACHTIDQGGRNGVGPNLHGILGRRAAGIEGFRYSPAMRAKAEAGLAWDEATLRAYIANPREVVPGNSMTYVGLRNPQQLDQLIAHLREAGGQAR
jgi:cytochrome c